jgi:hypothetical protein
MSECDKLVVRGDLNACAGENADGSVWYMVVIDLMREIWKEK